MLTTNSPWLKRLGMCTLLGLILGPAYLAEAQYYYESVPRFGQLAPFGSVRSMGMGGAQVSTGAESGGQGVNPASPAFLRKSEMMFGLSPYLNSTENSFQNGLVTGDKTGLPLSNFSAAFVNQKGESEGGDFRNGVFTVSYTRQAIYNRKSNWEGDINAQTSPGQFSPNSMIDVFLDNANTPGYYPKDILASNPDNQLFFFDNFKNDLVMAYNSYLLDTAGGNFVSAFPVSDLTKSGYVNQQLMMGAWNFGYSVNYQNKLYLGASFEYQRGSYSSEVSYGESIRNVYVETSNPNYNYLQGFKGVNFQLIRKYGGTKKGVSGNLGLIYKLSDAFRVGLSYQLPSYVWINETYTPEVSYNFLSLPYWNNRSQLIGSDKVTWVDNQFGYTLRIPSRIRVGATWIAGKKGMLSADLEYTDLSKSQLTNGDGNYNFISENVLVRNQFQSSLSFRGGGELRLGQLRLRAGAAYSPGTLKSGSAYYNNIHGDELWLTGGIGARFDTWYWDAALVVGKWNTRFTYDSRLKESVSSDVTSSQLRIGMGFFL